MHICIWLYKEDHEIKVLLQITTETQLSVDDDSHKDYSLHLSRKIYIYIHCRPVNKLFHDRWKVTLLPLLIHVLTAILSGDYSRWGCILHGPYKQEPFDIAGARFLQAGCPPCHLMKSVKALKETSEIRVNKMSQHLSVERALLQCVEFCRLAGFVISKPLHNTRTQTQHTTQTTAPRYSCITTV